MKHAGGYLEAKDLKRKKVLWLSEVYSVSYVPGMETDVQDVFITSIVPEGKNLLITDEKNRTYLYPLAR